MEELFQIASDRERFEELVGSDDEPKLVCEQGTKEKTLTNKATFSPPEQNSKRTRTLWNPISHLLYKKSIEFYFPFQSG